MKAKTLLTRAIREKIKTQVELLTPERDLAFAVIEKAVHDLRHTSPAIRIDAWLFLTNHNWASSGLSIDPEWIERLITKTGLVSSHERAEMPKVV